MVSELAQAVYKYREEVSTSRCETEAFCAGFQAAALATYQACLALIYQGHREARVGDVIEWVSEFLEDDDYPC
jgi:hypothetical protein